MRKRLSTILALAMMLGLLTSAGLSSAAGAASATIVEIKQRPWIIEDKGKLKSETELILFNEGSAFKAWAKISVPGEKAYLQPLGMLEEGTINKIVDVLELHKDGDKVTFEVYNNPRGSGKPVASVKRAQNQIRHWKVYVAHEMHTDIGYTDYQEKLNSSTFPGYLDDAFSAIDATKKWQKSDQFRYPVEASYMLYQSAWNNRNADWIGKLKANLNNHSMSYPSNYVNEVYGTLGTEELARINYFSERHLKDKLGVGSNKVAYMSDEPSFSWAAVDTMVESGVKYAMLRQNPDPMTPYPKLFYYQGRNAENKLLAYNYGHYATDEMDFRNPDSSVPYNNINDKLLDYQTKQYPYDAIIADFTTPYDNNGITTAVRDNIRNLNVRKDYAGRNYAYPKFIPSTVDDFFSYVEGKFRSQIPAFKGNIESWWNYGSSSTSNETGINKENHDKLPAAEFLATMANLAAPGAGYPYGELFDAYNHMILYDEHTWGNTSPQPDDIWKWKRNNAIAGNAASDRILSDSLSALASQIPTNGKSVAVFNTLSWSRTDLVKIQGGGLPEHFAIMDPDLGVSVKYQKMDDGTVAFVAADVPALGYKTYEIRQTEQDPIFQSSLKVTADSLENDDFKVTFDQTGAVTSIIDKKHGGKEMVDSGSRHRLNDFVYYTAQVMGPEVYSENTVQKAELKSSSGPVMAVMTADGTTTGVSAMKRNVILYDGIPRIDIVNDVNKNEAPPIAKMDEEAFFTFPLNVPNFTLRQEMPSGDVLPYVNKNVNNPANEQFYSSSTAYHTVNRWIDASNGSDYGLILSPISNPNVQYGERRSAMGDPDYNPKKPWIYSYVFNNKWHTNFQKTQPGTVSFKYALTSHEGADWKAGRADKFGMEASSSLQATFIPQSQSGGTLKPGKASLIGINRDNVVLTTAKLAEANGEGVILRFNETLGQDTKVTVDLRLLEPTSVNETDLVENDKAGMDLQDKTVTFTIKGHGWKTLRVKRGTSPTEVEGVNAVTDTYGTQITWNPIADGKPVYYEVFRGTDESFNPGPGTYVGTAGAPHFFDSQVLRPAVKGTYFYKVRAVNGGAKGEYSSVAKAGVGSINDKSAPTNPGSFSAKALFGTRVTLSWAPSADNVRVKGYKVYRDGVEIKNLAVGYNSYLDTEAAGEQTYEYAVKAYDDAGNLSEASDTAKVTTPVWIVPDGNVARLATATASSAYNDDYGTAKVNDGISGIHGSGEWASKGEQHPWVKLEWKKAQKVKQVMLFDRVNLADDANSGTLTFSDGSQVKVSGIPADGTGKEVNFPVKEVNWVRFDATGGIGGNVGLSEMEVR